MVKLLWYDFDNGYKVGKSNKAADVLSQRELECGCNRRRGAVIKVIVHSCDFRGISCFTFGGRKNISTNCK